MAILNTANLKSTITKEGQSYDVNNSSNTHRANNIDVDVTVVKTADKEWVLPNSVVRVNTKITNNTDQTIENLTIKDTLSEGVTFVAGSVKIGSVERPELDPIAGFDLTVTLGGFGVDMDISYEIQTPEYPEVGAFTNQTNVGFELESTQFSLDSNVLTINIIDNDISLLKTASSNVVKTGDQLTYTITITNNGEIENTNLFFTDTLPDTVEFVAGSVKVNDEAKDQFNPNDGFSLDNLGAGQTIKIVFDVMIK